MRFTAIRALLLGGVAGLLAFGAGAAVAGVLGAGDAALVLTLPVAFAAAGTVAVVRNPRNRAGRYLAAIGAWHLVAFGLTGVAAVLAGPGGAPWPLVLAARVAFCLGFVCYVGLFAVFPDGRYERRYERRTVHVAVAVGVLLPALEFLGRAPQEAPVELEPPVTAAPPVLLPVLAPLAGVTSAVLLAPLVGLALFVLRYRRSDASRREQMRWPLVSMVLAVAVLVAYNGLGLLGPGPGDVLFVAAFATLPVAVVLGMVRHRLLDVDVVLRGSLVYAVLWLAVGAAYVAVAAALGLLAARRFPVEVAVLITIAATLVFAPARRRLERWTDRLVFGERLSRYELLRRFGQTLEAQLDARAVGPRLAEAVERGLDASWVRVDPPHAAPSDAGPAVSVLDPAAKPRALPGPDEEASASTAGPDGQASVSMLGPDGQASVSMLGPDGQDSVLTVPITHAGEHLGTIHCGPKRGGGYVDTDRDLLATLARQAALAIRTSRLAADLAEQLAEVAASRARIVQAADAERRRIERDLHDGVQQELIALLAKAELARTALAHDRGAVDGILAELQDMTRRTHVTLRQLARGIHPTVLGDRGLIEAIEARAGELPVGVRIDATPGARGHRFPGEVELAAYFVVAEGLTNAVRHSGAPDVVVHVHTGNGTLEVGVADCGRGFDVADATGSGLAGLRDRLETLGGALSVQARPGGGTRLLATIPADGARRG